MLLVSLFLLSKNPVFTGKTVEDTMKTMMTMIAEALRFALCVAIAVGTLYALCACGPMEPEHAPAPDASLTDTGNEADAGTIDDAATLADASTPDADAPDAFVCEIPDGYGNGVWVKCFDSQVLCRLTWNTMACTAGCYEEDGDRLFGSFQMATVLDECAPSSPPSN